MLWQGHTGWYRERVVENKSHVRDVNVNEKKSVLERKKINVFDKND